MAISFNEKTRTFFLESKNTSYVFCITPTGFLRHLYYGPRISQEDLRDLDVLDNLDPLYMSKEEKPFGISFMRNEYPCFGLGDYREIALKATYFDGSRNNDVKYVSHEIRGSKTLLKTMPCVRDNTNELVIVLEDKHLQVKLFYSVYENEDSITRRAEITNLHDEMVVLNTAHSATLDLEGKNFDFINFPGGWAKERSVKRNPIQQSVITIDSKLGASSSWENPFIVILDKDTTEDNGRAFGLALVYSGSFAFTMEQTISNTLRISGGINDFDFSWPLKRNETFQTPELVMTFSNAGLTKMSQNLHDLSRNHLINPRYVNKTRPILMNNWEATYFDFDNKKLCGIIDAASELGIDTFVLDDGWFKNRNTEDTSLGDWEVDTKKLGGSLNAVINHCKEKGLKFGLWFEPEMISPVSELYKNHPEYAMVSPNGCLDQGRFQLVLDLSNPEVVDHCIEAISSILNQYDISYVKWDFNRYLTEYWGQTLKKEEQASVLHRYMLGAYRLMDTLINKRFPNIFFEGCASGGGRLDFGTLFYFPQSWCSDNTDAFSREMIQYGTSFAYPLSSFSGHVAAVPNHQTGRITPLQSRMDVASFCATGYEFDVTTLKEEEKQAIKDNIKRYKTIGNLILNGDLYRLASPFETDHFGQIVVSKDKSKAFAIVGNRLVTSRESAFYLKLKGLDPNSTYQIEETGKQFKGNTLMNFGLPFKPEFGDFVTKAFVLTKVD